METQSARYTFEHVAAIYQQPFNELLYQAHTTHLQHQQKNYIELATLYSIKTGACPEDCGYCSQSGHHATHVSKEKLTSVDDVVEKARLAKASGAKRFCMGAAWRSPPDSAMPVLQAMIAEVKALGLETCMTLGMLTCEQAHTLKQAGLDFYNHNIDTSPAYYEKIVTTRRFSDRLATLENVRQAGISVCCGGILGLGETEADRIAFLLTLVNLEQPPASVPINCLIPVPGTPLANAKPVEWFELVRTVACARILMPNSMIRLTAGRTAMCDELQALCFFAGANSVFIGSKLFTEDNPEREKDNRLFATLGLTAINVRENAIPEQEEVHPAIGLKPCTRSDPRLCGDDNTPTEIPKLNSCDPGA